MSQQLVRTEQLELTPANMAALTQHPLQAVPVELRPAIWSAWVVQQHLFPSVLPIAGAIALDLNNGLTIEDAKAVLSYMGRPELRSKFRFAADFMTELSRLTAIRINWREQDRKNAALAAPVVAPEQADAVREQIHDLAQGFTL